MVMLGTSVTGPRSPDEVWERYARPALWSSWAPQITRVEADDRMGPDSTGRVHGLLGITADFEVISWDDAERTWTWRVHGRLPLGAPGPTLDLFHTVEPAGEGSKATLAVRGALPWVAAYLPAARLALYRLVH